jgi:hypothetical protein
MQGSQKADRQGGKETSDNERDNDGTSSIFGKSAKMKNKNKADVAFVEAWQSSTQHMARSIA